MGDDPIKRAAGEAARHFDAIRTVAPAGAARPIDLRRHLERAYRFEAPCSISGVLDDVARMLGRGTVHATHPGYFGPYQGGVMRSAIAASTLVAAFDPQCALHATGAAAIELEQHALRALARSLGGSSLGWRDDDAAMHTCAGGQEANVEALVVAATRACPAFRDHGARAFPRDPAIYVSAEAHHGIEKAAHAVGLGRASVRRIAVDGGLRMDVRALEDALARDRATCTTVAIVATAGTTSSGAIDPLEPIADVCDREGAWLHCGAALSPRLRAHLAGIDRSRSITLDGHKWLQLPLGSGMFFCREPAAVRAAFETDAPYMPRPREDALDPYRASLAWSRRAAGIPLFVALAELGEEGLAAMIDRMASLGDRLRAGLEAAGFEVVHPSPLPVACFTHPRLRAGERSVGEVARAVQARGRAWISPTRLSTGASVLRACIDNARTEPRDLDALLEDLALAMA